MEPTYLIEFFKKGGLVMYPIMGCSIIMLGVAIERFWNLRKSRILPERFINDVLGLLRGGKFNDAIIFCKTNHSVIANILTVIIEHFVKKNPDLRKVAVEQCAREFIYLDKYLPILSAVTGLAPLLGFYGTVIGMIQVFQKIETMGTTNIKFLSGGIYVAIITTAFGLTVAIPSFIASRYFEARTNSIITNIEEYVEEAVNILLEHNKA